jgi:hypothetical protein
MSMVHKTKRRRVRRRRIPFALRGPVPVYQLGRGFFWPKHLFFQDSG